MRFNEMYKYTPLNQPKWSANKDWVTAYPIEERFVPVHNYLFGLEIETENFSTAAYQQMFSFGHSQYYWQCHEDRSLRNHGMELVSNVLSGLDAAMAFGFLDRINNEIRPTYNDRTGTHVHLNARPWNVQNFMSAVALYIIYEPALFRYSGGRTDSIYCVPLRIAEHPLRNLFASGEVEKQDGVWPYIATKGHKYMAMNYLPISKSGFGSVEFRHMVGTNDLLWIINWVNIIQRLSHYARNPIQKTLPEIFSLGQSSFEKFTDDVFQEQAVHLKSSTLWKEIREGIILLKEWTVAQSDVEQFIEDKPKEKSTSRDHKKDPLELLRMEQNRFARPVRAVDWIARPAPEAFRNDYLVQREALIAANVPVGGFFVVPGEQRVNRIVEDDFINFDEEAGVNVPNPPNRPQR